MTFSDITPKTFAAIFQQVHKRILLQHHHHSSSEASSIDDIRQSYLPDKDELMATILITTIQEVLTTAGSEQWDHITLHKRLQELGMDEDKSEIFTAFWKLEKEKVHDVLYHRSISDGALAKFNWRIDVKISSEHQTEVHEPTAILEIQSTGAGASSLIEMSRQEVFDTLQTLKTIQEKMSSLSN